MPSAACTLQEISWVAAPSPEPVLDSRVLALPEEAFCVGRSFSSFGDSDRWVWTDREQLLLALELVPQTPQLAAGGRDVDVQATTISETIRLICSFGFADLGVGQHQSCPKYPVCPERFPV